MHDPENSVIVYGTSADVAGNRAAAFELQKSFRVKWWTNIKVMPASSIGDALKGKHVIRIGRPGVIAIAHQCAAQFPVKFGSASFRVNDQTFAHETSAAIVGGVNAVDPRFSMILIAGNSADATYHAAQSLVKAPSAQVLVIPRGQAPVPMVSKGR